MTKKSLIKSKDSMTDDSVLVYLQSEPDFFVRHPDALQKMTPPPRDLNKGVSDFQNFFVDRLKGQIRDLRAAQRELIENGAENYTTLNRIHAAALRLCEATSIEDLGQIIRHEIPALCGVDRAILALEGEGFGESIAHLNVGQINTWLGPADVMLHAHTMGYPEIFGIDTAAMRSFALLRLETRPAYTGAIAFGSHDPEGFSPDQATDLVSFLNGILSRRLNHFLI